MNSTIIIISLCLIGLGISLMVIRDYRTMKRVTRKDKNSDQFLLNLDSHDPTPYGKLLGINDEGEGSEQSKD
jgi:hypothetical protein